MGHLDEHQTGETNVKQWSEIGMQQQASKLGTYSISQVGCIRPGTNAYQRRHCAKWRFFSGWSTSGTERGVDQVSRVCVSWLCQPPGKGRGPSVVARTATRPLMAKMRRQQCVWRVTCTIVPLHRDADHRQEDGVSLSATIESGHVRSFHENKTWYAYALSPV